MRGSVSELDRRIQRCVDGELSNADEVALLRHLDLEPAAWRQLALGFVEDRLFRQSAKDCLADAPMVANVVEHVPKHDYWHLSRLLALSVCLGVALGVTWIQWSRSSKSGEQPLVGLRTPMGSVVNGPTAAVRQAPQAIEPGLVSLVANAAVPPDYELDLQVDGAGAVKVPIYHPSHITPEMLEQRPVVPRELRERLQRQGYAIDQHREYMLIPLEDGRRVLIPQDSVKVRYAVQ